MLKYRQRASKTQKKEVPANFFKICNIKKIFIISEVFHKKVFVSFCNMADFYGKKLTLWPCKAYRNEVMKTQ